jgi:hypothetical protein
LEAVRILRAHIRAGRDNVLADLKQRQEIRQSARTGLPRLEIIEQRERKGKEKWQQIS